MSSRALLDLLILKTLSLEPLHDSARPEESSRSREESSRSTRIAIDGPDPSRTCRWLDSEWREDRQFAAGEVSTRSRAAGKRQLEAETADWTRRAAAVARILKSEA